MRYFEEGGNKFGYEKMDETELRKRVKELEKEKNSGQKCSVKQLYVFCKKMLLYLKK